MIDETQPILGGPFVGHDRLFAVLRRRANVLPAQRAQETQIASAYAAGGQLAGVSDALAFAQGWHETGGFRSERWVQACNSAGMGATNDGAWGATFPTPAAGIIAQFAHLVNYAVELHQQTPLHVALAGFDPRLAVMVQKGLFGTAPRWIDLNGRWAYPGTTYAQRIFRVARELGLL